MNPQSTPSMRTDVERLFVITKECPSDSEGEKGRHDKDEPDNEEDICSDLDREHLEAFRLGLVEHCLLEAMLCRSNRGSVRTLSQTAGLTKEGHDDGDMRTHVRKRMAPRVWMTAASA
jgi:hypothetical protein